MAMIKSGTVLTTAGGVLFGGAGSAGSSTAATLLTVVTLAGNGVSTVTWKVLVTGVATLLAGIVTAFHVTVLAANVPPLLAEPAT